jgi:hypothetical protein
MATKDYGILKASIEEKKEKFKDNFFEYIRITKTNESRKMFDLALEIIYMEIIKKKDEIINDLESWKILLGLKLGNNRTEIKNIKNSQGLESFYKNISLCFPVITSTLSSSGNLHEGLVYNFKNGENIVKVDYIKDFNPIDLVLVDEAGMSTPLDLLPLFNKSNRAVVVGDPVQLEPIRVISDVAQIEYEENFFEDSASLNKYSPFSTTSFHRASLSMTGKSNDFGESITLDEHRRCQTDIAELFISLADYQNINVLTPALGNEDREKLNKLGGKNLLFYDVYGKKGFGNENLEEADKILDILTKIESAGYDLSVDVGIITPFAHQEKLLIARFGKMLEHGFDKAKIGTIHKFQGVEFKIVIFSSVIHRAEHPSSFINSSANLLNVAISRAKHLFIVVGNFEKLHSSGSYLKKMCETISKKGFLVEIPEDVIIEDSSLPIISTCEHLIVLKEWLEQAKKEIIIVSPWIYDYNNKSLHLQYNLIKKALERGVVVYVVYGWNGNNKDLKERETPELLNRYKELLGENLIKLKNGTHEKTLIIDREEMYSGSFNWLSHNYNEYCKEENYFKAQVRREISVLNQDTAEIEKYVHYLLKEAVRVLD